MLDALKGKPVEIPLLCLRLAGVARPFLEAASLKTAQLVDLRKPGRQCSVALEMPPHKAPATRLMPVNKAGVLHPIQWVRRKGRGRWPAVKTLSRS